MDSVFSRFDSYQFDADERFVAGVKTLSSQSRPELLDMKLFFYSRFVEPIDGNTYKQWRTSPGHVTAEGEAVEQQDDQTPSHSDADISDHQTETKQLSFAEVMQFVQEGKDVPGVKKLDIRASNQSATPSKMKRLLKPWETTSA